jgi:hypothetical protein
MIFINVLKGDFETRIVFFIEETSKVIVQEYPDKSKIMENQSVTESL